jgi:peroxiredoxin
MPQFVEAHNTYRDDGLVVIALNLQESESIIRPFAEDFGMGFPILIDRDGEVGDRYRLLGLPATFFIDRDGVVQSVFTGPFERSERGTDVRGAIAGSELEQRIAEILAPEEASDGGG